MKRIKQFAVPAVQVIGIAALICLVPWLVGIAHAATDPAAAVTAATSDLGWPEWIGIGLAALAGIRTIVDAGLAFFRYLAPKTRSKVDDTIRDDLQLAHDKLDALSSLVQGIAGQQSSAKTKQGGFTRVQVMLLVAAAGVALVASMGCMGSTQATRQTTLSTATVVATTMLKTVETYDKTAGDAIVSSATDPAKAKAELAALRSKVHASIKVITAVIDAIGLANSLNDDHSLQGVQEALAQAISDVTALTGGK
ncbi:MAG TPA: hypothetical protein VFT22_07415 [Kofleriaceae bacterium]|nr:hypothetical protein [Kofleriaceae bacterium]